MHEVESMMFVAIDSRHFPSEETALNPTSIADILTG